MILKVVLKDVTRSTIVRESFWVNATIETDISATNSFYSAINHFYFTYIPNKMKWILAFFQTGGPKQQSRN